MAKRQTYIAKVTRPSAKGVYKRKRLFRLLENSIKTPSTWVSGPPGSGKTTLISSFIEERKMSCIWCRLDKLDNDLATFFYYMGEAGKKAAPGRRRKLPLLTPEYALGIPTFARQFFEEIFKRLSSPGIIVFDNYQTIPEKSPLQEILQLGISSLPEGINIILISRNEMPSGFARMLANSRISRLGWPELRLDLEETEGIARLHLPDEQVTKRIRDVHEISQGWAAGLILMLEKKDPEAYKNYQSGEHTFDEIFDYFASETFQRVEKNMQDFFLQTAFLSSMTAGMARELTGQHRAGHILSNFNRNNFFTEKRAGADPVYQYHALFRDFLQSMAKDRFAAEELSGLQRKSAAVLEAAGYIEESAGLYARANYWEGLIRLIMNHAQIMLMQGRNLVVDRWLNGLPEDIIEKTPWLQFWLGSCRFPFNPVESRQILESAFNGFYARKDIAGIFMAWAKIVHTIYFGFEGFKPLDKWITLLDRLIKEFGGIPQGEIETRVASSMFDALVIRQPGHPDFNAWRERALKLAEKNPDINLMIQVLYEASFHHSYSGDLAQSSIFLKKMKGLIASEDMSPFSVLSVRLAESCIYFYLGQNEDCIEAVNSGLELSRKSGIHIMDLLLTGHAVLAFLMTDRLILAREYLDKMEEIYEHSKFDMALYHMISYHYYAETGDQTLAMAHAEQTFELGKVTGSIVHDILTELAIANALIDLGEYEKAGVHMLSIHRILDENEFGALEVPYLFTEAYMCYLKNSEKKGLNALRKAMEMARNQGLINNYVTRTSVMSFLCARALESGIEVEHVHKIIRKCGLTPPKPAIHMENWPWKVKVYTMGRFGIVRDGKPVNLSGKVPKMPILMFKTLVAMGGRNVSEGEIMDILWPNADGDLAYRSFNTTLHRLRKLLGYDEAVQMREGGLTIDPRTCWVDIWAFERIAGESEELSTVALAEKAVGMYGGAFLPGEKGAYWSLSIRERLRNKYLLLVERIGDYYEKEGKWKQAAENFRKGLEVDDLAEIFYQRLMICYGKLGQKAEAVTVFNQCSDRLSSALGIAPSSETERIHNGRME
jgi:ATP/maltotriose-dependent transcriptional regulator MalT/DNA-binding SARP family transcriptional activator